MLRLESISKQVGAETHLHSMDLNLEPGTINVLLGATRAGKTSLLRVLAGLEAPTSGRVVQNDRDLTHVPVRQRNLAMVYQQFINYPSLTVFDNIASPLKLQRRTPAEITRRVGAIAEILRITPFLDRLPAELSGGQQQRTALARALAKDAELLLLDEPLVNLDYKLREELRAELTQLFAGKETTVVYATTEPMEALQLGGRTAILHEGRLLQYGPTVEVFGKPVSLAAARAFSDPPLNLFDPKSIGADVDPRTSLIGVRPHHLHTEAFPGGLRIAGRVQLAEIAGSDTFVHLANEAVSCVAQMRGVHDLQIGAPCVLYFSVAQAFGFDARGDVVFIPE